MNIDKRIVCDADEVAELDGFINSNPSIGDDRNARRRYYRILDRITGEPGMYGSHRTEYSDMGCGTRQVSFEHRRQPGQQY